MLLGAVPSTFPPTDLSLASTVWMEQTWRCPYLLLASDHLPTSSPVATFRTTSVILGPRDQPTPFSDLNSLLPGNHELPDLSELFHQCRGPVSRLATLHLRASHTSLSLGSYFHGDNVALNGVGHFFRELAKKCRGARQLLKMQNQGGSHPLFQDMQRPPQGEWGDTRDSLKPLWTWRRT